MPGLFDIFGGSTEEDYSTLPEKLKLVYKNAWNYLGLQSGDGPNELRDAFRRQCAILNPEFVFPRPKYDDFQMILFAYRLCMGELKGPAKELGIEIRTNTLYHGVQPDDFITWLRPLHCAGMEVDKRLRAAKALHLTFMDTTWKGLYSIYNIRVSYCMRITQVSRRYSEFLELHRQIQQEILILPGFPEPNFFHKFGIGQTHETRAMKLCEYLMTIHQCLGARGVFSPRLMKFLNIDYARVQYEEEGRLVVNVLDSTGLMHGSQWQMINAEWLDVWRKFVQSRGARRYKPPGKINNGELIEKLESGKKLTAGKHYRAVNFNVWWYLYKIYGGGPEITRKSRDIEDKTVVLGKLQAIYKIQAVIRGYLARRQYTREYLTKLASTAPGVREVLYTKKQNELVQKAQENIEKAKESRKDKRLEHAVRFTQQNWRMKKQYGSGEGELKIRKHIQEVFARVGGAIEEASQDQPLVVEEKTNIINIGSTETYEYTIENPTEGNKLPIGFAKQKNSEKAFVKTRDPKDQRLIANVPKASVLLAINGYPVNNLTYTETKERLGAARFPLTLLLKRPLLKHEALKLSEILNIQNEEVKLNELKRRLVRGTQLIKHCKGFRVKPHETRLSIDGENIHWETRGKKKEKDTQKQMSLFELTWCAKTDPKKKVTAVFKKAKFKKKEREEIYKRCFSIASEKRTLDFEVMKKSGEAEDLASKRRDLLVWGFQKIIEEIKSKQLILDKDGNPIKRKQAKRRLRAI